MGKYTQNVEAGYWLLIDSNYTPEEIKEVVLSSQFNMADDRRCVLGMLSDCHSMWHLAEVLDIADTHSLVEYGFDVSSGVVGGPLGIKYIDPADFVELADEWIKLVNSV